MASAATDTHKSAAVSSSGGIGATLGRAMRRPEAGSFLGLIAVFAFFVIRNNFV